MRSNHPSKLLAFVTLGLALSFPHPVFSFQTPVTPTAASEMPSTNKLLQLKQNPVSGLKQIGFEANISPGYPDSMDTLGVYSLQVVWPFSINEDYRLISYTILPVLHLPETPGESGETGLGDTLINLFVSPKEAKEWVWGFGTAILLPTRTDPVLGSDRVGVGPAAVLFYQQQKWNAGVDLQNVWSLGSASGVNEVNALGAQYLLQLQPAPRLVDLQSNSTISADWTRESDERWTVPVGGGVGKLYYVGPLPVSVSLQAFYNVVTPTDGPEWSANFQFSFLFGAPE